jgi:hypothetical protein
MKQLISTINDDEKSNQFYYNKMLTDFETETRYEELKKKQRNKWKAESVKYLERVFNMKEKKEDMYKNKINKYKNDIHKKELGIKNRLNQNKITKNEERQHSMDITLKKEQNAKQTYNRKLELDEKQRKKNEKKVLQKCKIYIILFFLISKIIKREK